MKIFVFVLIAAAILFVAMLYIGKRFYLMGIYSAHQRLIVFRRKYILSLPAGHIPSLTRAKALEVVEDYYEVLRSGFYKNDAVMQDLAEVSWLHKQDEFDIFFPG